MGRYSYYFYDLDKKWYVFDNQTNCLVAGTGTESEAEAQLKAEEYNTQNK